MHPDQIRRWMEAKDEQLLGLINSMDVLVQDTKMGLDGGKTESPILVTVGSVSRTRTTSLGFE